MIRCRSKNGDQKDMYFEETSMHDHKMLTILGSIVNMIGGTHMTT